MRVTDDLGDDAAVSLEKRVQRLKQWNERLERTLSLGQTDDPVLTAVADVVHQYGVSPEFLRAVVEGVRMDLEGFHCETFEDLRRYCFHVAGAVGLCCIQIWGFQGELPRQEAEACGLAFQLTNILRDLREDVENGRVYLPAEDFKQFGYHVEELKQQVQNERFRRLMAFEVERTERFYEQAQELFQKISPAGRPMLRAMVRIYHRILHEIRRANFDVFSRRCSPPKWYKLLVATQALIESRLPFHR